jgi:hypothetical protein
VPVNEAEVTPVEIARLAGVGRAAVSNWRRRHEDFPQPVGGTATSPRFALTEVEAWLRRQGKLAALPAEERAWQEIRAASSSDHELPAALRRAGRRLLDGAGPAALTELAAAHGVPAAFELLLRRTREAARLPRLPAPVAELMVGLLGPAAKPAASPASLDRSDGLATIYDPACGTGDLLVAAAAGHPRARVVGDETDPVLRDLAELRVRAHHGGDRRFGSGGLRHAPDPAVEADGVLCYPPGTERDWAAGDLAYDPRWQYGVPPKAEPELAWVQHALANLRPGGRAVLLLPPAVAARQSGRRIRAELLRRGALRAVVGLPPGAAPPHNLGLHLWLLRRPSAEDRADRVVIAELPAVGVAPTALLAAMDAGSDPATGRAFRVMDLLDDTVDLSPGRRLRTETAPVDAAEVVRLRDRLGEQLRRLAELLPGFDAAPAPTGLPMITIADLARAGAVTVTLHNPLRQESTTGEAPVWRARDVVAGHPPGGRLPAEQVPDDAVRLAAGEVVAPVISHQLIARVVTGAEAGALLGPNLYLLRPDPAVLDPWFLAGFLRRDSNTHRAGSLGSIQRYDVRRAQVPRVPVEEQRRYGELFRRIAEFDGSLRLATETGDILMKRAVDALATGTLLPRS